MEIRVNQFHVIQSNWLPKQLLVERQREAPVNVVPVEHSHPHDPAHKMEIGQVFLEQSTDKAIQLNKTLLLSMRQNFNTQKRRKPQAQTLCRGFVLFSCTVH